MPARGSASGIIGPGRSALGFAADAAAVMVFAAIGRRSHRQDEGIGAVFTTAAPFLLALLIGWAVAAGIGRSGERLRDPGSPTAGVIVAAVTVGGGLLMRRLLWDRGTALAFVIVAAAFLAATMIGWRGRAHQVAGSGYVTDCLVNDVACNRDSAASRGTIRSRVPPLSGGH